MPTTTSRTRARIAGVLASFALVLLASCSGHYSDRAAAALTGTPVAQDLAAYDAFVAGSTVNDPANADLYGIRFNPFEIDRITVDKRISSLGADKTHLVVAAADEATDHLAQVTGTGDLQPIPGLGRPFAYSPQIIDGIMYFDDAQGDETTGKNRFFAWDLKKQTKTLVFQTNDDEASATPISGGRLLTGRTGANGRYEPVIRSKTGKLTAFPMAEDVHGGALGGSRLAFTLVGPNDRFGDSPVGTLLLDLDTGKQQRIPGLQVIAWNPTGTRLLARRTDVLTDSKLVLLDPAKPDAPMDLHTVPGLALYGGVWVRGEVAS